MAAWFDLSSTRPNAIPFALDADGNWRDVAEVERGLACDCVCPECAGQVVAKKGKYRVYHFAHHNLLECRHALETALFGMTVELLGAPGAVLQLPGHGDRAAWLREASIDRHITPPPPFASGQFIIPPHSVAVPTGFEIRSRRLSDSASDAADLIAPDLKLAVHLLSHRKPYTSLRNATHAPGWSVLALNLNHYVKLWWETCDPDKDAKVAQAMHARDQLKRWLAQEQGGRGFLQHAEESEVRQKFDFWIAEIHAAAAKRMATASPTKSTGHAWKSTVVPVNLAAIKSERAAAVKEMDAKWRIPTIPGVPLDAQVYQAVPARLGAGMGSLLAAEIGLKWHGAFRTYVFIGRVGALIPEGVRPFMSLDGKWKLVTDADRLT